MFSTLKNILNELKEIKEIMKKILILSGGSPYGDELIINGTFDTDVSGWDTNNANATITWDNGKALITSASFAFVRLNPALNLNIGDYLVEFEVSELTGTLSNLHIGLDTSGNVITSNGSYSYIYSSSGGVTEFQIRPNSGGTGSLKIDNISVREVL